MKLRILSGGAAKSVVTALADEFRANTGYALECSFSAVGAMKAQLLGGGAADLVILTRALIDELELGGHVLPRTGADLGRVRTGVAVRAGEAVPDIASADGLRRALLAADGIFTPDTQKATAGIHFARVLAALGIHSEVAGRLRTYPNGNTAMSELARTTVGRQIGCTQITEIKSTPGVVLAGPLPHEFELATTYTAGVCTAAANPNAARQLVALLAGDASRALRMQAGFELA